MYFSTSQLVALEENSVIRTSFYQAVDVRSKVKEFNN
jgi:hypothetical protein